MIGVFFLLVFGMVGSAFASPASFLDTLTSQVNVAMASSVIVAGVLEFVFRLVPTTKPLSWAWLASAALHSLGKLSEAVAEFMDKVLPQNTNKQ